MKKLYVTPKMQAVNISVGNALLAASSCEEEKREFIPETTCPFNNSWCVDKQKRFNAWRVAMDYAAKNHTRDMFVIRSDLFFGCPHGYKSLCAVHKYKQR